MKKYKDAADKLIQSLFETDILIFLCALFTLVFMVLSLIFAKGIKKRENEWQENKNLKFSRYIKNGAKICYTVFITAISLFPLLGMLGTVMGLLGLDLSNGDMENIKNNFFVALTSTAWGIIFSVIFKIINAFIADFIEEKIEVAKRLEEK